MITQDRFVRLSLPALAALLLAGCETGPQVRSITEPGANLSAYRTYSFAAQPGTNRGGNLTPLTTFFETAIAREMTARGYQQVENGGDLLVNFNARVSEKADIQSTPGPMYGYGYYGYRGGMYMGPEVQTVRYKVGTANIDVVDAKRKVVVWEGIAERELSDDIMRNPQPAIDNTVAKMFAQFPGRAAPP
ncbi:MAG TPA: DUF4136 domain-containing protein [Steroidobacteraceae bacterium]|jgi:hypothetical protein|nr:DUF4136 domain-containing protein [Steroidobacteraceae bacterium]